MNAAYFKTGLLRLLQLALLATLLLRVLVPVGYMPAKLSEGWPVQLCPDGMSAAAMTALLGDQHQHHGMHAMHGGAHSDLAMTAKESAPALEAAPGKCDLAAFSGAVAPPASAVAIERPVTSVAAESAVAALHVRSVAFERYRSRAPPA